MRFKIMPQVLLAAVLALAFATRAHAVLEIEITQGVERPLPIAVAPFTSSAGVPLPEDVAAIVAADLDSTGLFNSVAQGSFPQQPETAAEINFQLWRNQGIEKLVIGSLQPTSEGEVNVSFQLFDTIYGKQSIGYSIPTSLSDLRRAAHKISDLIYEEITGESGAFSTLIAYISTQSSPTGDKRYVLQIADSDGYNPRTIFTSSMPLLSPAWSPDGSRIAYVSFESQRPEIFIQDIAGGERMSAAGSTQLNSAPAFSPDGQQLALTRSENGNADIYILDLTSNRLTRLTDYSSIDTEAEWMPDGESLVFTSDRGGQPQLYELPVTGGDPQRLTFEGNYNAGVDVSPDGEQIAMVHNDGSGFHIAVQDIETGQLRKLTNGTLDESPSFAPNGSTIIYATAYQGADVLAAVSADGRIRQRLQLEEGEVREPVWGPFQDDP
jgi:TolB protein